MPCLVVRTQEITEIQIGNAIRLVVCQTNNVDAVVVDDDDMMTMIESLNARVGTFRLSSCHCLFSVLLTIHKAMYI